MKSKQSFPFHGLVSPDFARLRLPVLRSSGSPLRRPASAEAKPQLRAGRQGHAPRHGLVSPGSGKPSPKARSIGSFRRKWARPPRPPLSVICHLPQGLVSPDSEKPTAPSPVHGVVPPKKESGPNATLKSGIRHLASVPPVHPPSRSPLPPSAAAAPLLRRTGRRAKEGRPPRQPCFADAQNATS